MASAQGWAAKKMLSYQEAKTYYDAFGKKQDKQFYEKAALKKLLHHGVFQKAENIIEFGCGTGKVAHTILLEYASEKTHYTGLDISQTMIDLTRKRLSEFAERVKVYRTDGAPIIPEKDESFDRFVSTYVFDLLNEDDIKEGLKEAHRILKSDGYLCLSGLTHGISVLSRLVEKLVRSLHQLNPSIVGGCRPIHLIQYLAKEQWEIIHNSVILSFGVPSEVVIAKKRMGR